MTTPATQLIEIDRLPRVYRLADNLFAIGFRNMKLVPATHILSAALASGEIEPGGLVAETTSGTFGLGLARTCRACGFRLHLVSDPAIDSALQARLEMLGATVDIVDADQSGSYQRPRLQRLETILASERAYWPRQYDNPMNRRSYHPIVDYVLGELGGGTIHHLVAAYGSGGSGSGCAERLIELGHPLQTHAVDTPRSVIFGHPDGKRALRGLGNSILPSNVDYSLVDEVHWIPAGLAFSAAYRLARTFGGLDAGVTAGAAYLVARDVARRHPRQRVLVIFADDGERYRTTFLSKPWLEARGLFVDSEAAMPSPVNHPLEAGDQWSCFAWRRQSRQAVLAKAAI